jgi:hypothetical protein
MRSDSFSYWHRHTGKYVKSNIPLMNSTLRSMLPLVTGAFVGALGAILIQRSLPPKAGSPQEQIVILENDLRKAQMDLRAWEDSSPRKRFGATTHDNVRSIAQAIKEGRPVSPDDIFNSFKPLMRDLSPLTERMQAIEIKRSAEARAGACARKYGLTESQQKQLVDNLVFQNTEQMKQHQNMLLSDHVSMSEYMKAERETDRDLGLDETMAAMLKGEKREEFLTDRLTEKAERVQYEADGKVERIDNIVKLDEKQRHQMFLNMAQTSRHYDPQMQFDGLQEGLQPAAQGMSSEQAMMSVLRPEQRQAYDAHRQQRLQKAQEEAAAIGLTIPNDWDPDDDIGF